MNNADALQETCYGPVSPEFIDRAAKIRLLILDVDGVDGVFIGPADLSADMGFAGNPQHPEVQAAIEQALQPLAVADSVTQPQALADTEQTP